MNKAFADIKQELGSIARQIKHLKSHRHSNSCPNENIRSRNANDAVMLSKEFRHRHIAYCILRGKTIEKIEAHPPSISNLFDRSEVERFISEYEQLIYDSKITAGVI